MIGSAVHFLKGHGTGNDFVVLPDARVELSVELVRALCDRRTGLGADGVLRVAPGADGVAWFMDHRNADGSLAEMCGNGLRLFARYLVDSGRAEPGEQRIGTRAGVRRAVVRADGSVRVEMGRAVLGAAASATVDGGRFAGTAVSVGNPHLVCLTDVPVAALDLRGPPVVDAGSFPKGVNVEFGNVGVLDGVDAQVRMRVHERGVGETQACGTGACAIAAVVLQGADGVVAVDQPGGQVLVEVAADGCWLTGPAVVVGSGELDPTWLAAAL